MFSLTAALNPTLLTATTVMLLLPSPKRLMLGYLAGAVTTGIVVGIAIVDWLQGSAVVRTTERSVSPGIDLAFGVIALIAAYTVETGRAARVRRRRAQGRAGQAKKTPRWQEALSHGSPRTTFLIGLLLSFPGASYLAALTEIARRDLGTAGSVLTIVAVNAVMLILLEVPLVCFAVAPERTPSAIARGKGWLAAHGARAIVVALTIIGTALLIRGALEIVS